MNSVLEGGTSGCYNYTFSPWLRHRLAPECGSTLELHTCSAVREVVPQHACKANDWRLCTAFLHMDHLVRTSSHCDRVSDIQLPQTTATLVEEWCRSKDASVLRPDVRMMLCQTLYAIGHACRAKVLKPWLPVVYCVLEGGTSVCLQYTL